MSDLGDFVSGSTVFFTWHTNDSSGGAVSRSTVTPGTVKVYKDNSTAGSTGGITDTPNFNAVTGVHACNIDLGSTAFYTTAANYAVHLENSSISSQVVNAVLKTFSIENRTVKSVLTDTVQLRANTTSLMADSTLVLTDTVQLRANTTSIMADTSALKVDSTAIKIDTTQLRANSTSLLADSTLIKGSLSTLLADTSALKVDSTAIKLSLSTIESKLDTAQIDLNTITGADGVTLASSQANYAPLKGGVAMTEAYAADGVAPTPEQMLYMIWSALSEFAISGTTITTKKINNTTTAMTFTIDDNTNPTSRTRAS